MKRQPNLGAPFLEATPCPVALSERLLFQTNPRAEALGSHLPAPPGHGLRSSAGALATVDRSVFGLRFSVPMLPGLKPWAHISRPPPGHGLRSSACAVATVGRSVFSLRFSVPMLHRSDRRQPRAL